MPTYIEEEAPASESGLDWEEVETPPAFEELVILCLDTSLSMANDQYPDQPGISRTQHLIDHIFDEKVGLYARLMGSDARRRFWSTVLTFSDRVEVAFPVTKLLSPDGARRQRPNPIDPVARQMLFAHRRGTVIGEVLVVAEQIATGWIEAAEALPRMVTIAIISDGKPFLDTADAVAEANRINATQTAVRVHRGLRREPIVIATAAYGHGDTDQADWSTLKRIATDPVRFYAEPKNGRELRKFLESTILLER